MRIIHLLAPLVFMIATSAFEAHAEGRCPPGQYPIGGPGVGGCAPIPGGEGAATSWRLRAPLAPQQGEYGRRRLLKRRRGIVLNPAEWDARSQLHIRINAWLPL